MVRNAVLRAAIVAVLVPTLARAEPGPAVAAGVDVTIGHRGDEVEMLDLGLRLEPGVFVRIKRWQATLSFPWHPYTTILRPEVRSADLTGFGISGRLAYRPEAFGGVLALGGGFAWHWIWGEEVVMRTCAESGDCIAGTYIERPTRHYHAWAPQLRAGIALENRWPSTIAGMSFEIIVEWLGINGARRANEGTVFGAVTLTLGGGPSD